MEDLGIHIASDKIKCQKFKLIKLSTNFSVESCTLISLINTEAQF